MAENKQSFTDQFFNNLVLSKRSKRTLFLGGAIVLGSLFIAAEIKKSGKK